MIRLLKMLAVFCFGGFLICAAVTAVSGMLLIWAGGREQYDTRTWLTCMSAFLLMVLSGLIVSGTGSMLGVLSDGRPPASKRPSDREDG